MTARMPPPWAPLPEDRAYGLGAGDRVDGVLAPLVRFLDVGLSLREDVPGAWPAHTFAAAALALVERAYACEAAKDVIQEEDVIWDVARLRHARDPGPAPGGRRRRRHRRRRRRRPARRR